MGPVSNPSTRSLKSWPLRGPLGTVTPGQIDRPHAWVLLALQPRAGGPVTPPGRQSSLRPSPWCQPLEKAAASRIEAGPLSPGAGPGRAVREEGTRVGTGVKVRWGDHSKLSQGHEGRTTAGPLEGVWATWHQGWARERPQASAAPSELDNRQFSSSGQNEEGIPQEVPPASDWTLLPTESRHGLSPQHRLQAMTTRSQNWQVDRDPRASPPLPPCRLSFWLSNIVLLNIGDRWWFLDMV